MESNQGVKTIETNGRPLGPDTYVCVVFPFFVHLQTFLEFPFFHHYGMLSEAAI